MEGSDGQQLWRNVGGEQYTVRGEHGMKQDIQLFSSILHQRRSGAVCFCSELLLFPLKMGSP